MANNEFDLTDDGMASNNPSRKMFSGKSYMSVPEEVKIFKPVKNEQHQVRFITLPGVGSFTQLVLCHFNVGGRNSVTCPIMFGENCPMCEQRKKLFETNKEAAKAFKQSRYNIGYVIDRAKEGDGPKLWRIHGTQTIKRIDTLITNPKTKKRFNLGHPETGKDLFFMQYEENGSDYATINDLALDPDVTPLANDNKQTNDWVEFIKANPISGMINRFTYDEIEALMSGEDEEIESSVPSTESFDDEFGMTEDEPFVPAVIKAPVSVGATSTTDRKAAIEAKLAALKAKGV